MGSLKFKVGDKVSWQDGGRHMVGTIVQAYMRSRTPNSYYMRIKDKKRLFMRYETELRRTG